MKTTPPRAFARPPRSRSSTLGSVRSTFRFARDPMQVSGFPVRHSLGEGGRSQVSRVAAAFTLIEILVVLAIIGLLVGVLVTKSDKIFGRSQTAVAGIFVRNTASVPLLSYRRDMGDYPSTQEGLQALVTAPGARAESWHGPYMDAPGGRVPVDPWGEPYQYRYPGTKNAGGYDLYSKGPDKQPDTADDIGNW